MALSDELKKLEQDKLYSFADTNGLEGYPNTFLLQGNSFRPVTQEAAGQYGNPTALGYSARDIIPAGFGVAPMDYAITPTQTAAQSQAKYSAALNDTSTPRSINGVTISGTDFAAQQAQEKAAYDTAQKQGPQSTYVTPEQQAAEFAKGNIAIADIKGVPVAPQGATSPVQAAPKVPFRSGLSNAQTSSIYNLLNTNRAFNETDARNYAYSINDKNFQQYIGKKGSDLFPTTPPTNGITGTGMQQQEKPIILTGAGTGDTTGSSASSIAANQIVADIKARQDIYKQTQTKEQQDASNLDTLIGNLTGQQAGKASFEAQQRTEKESALNQQLTSIKNQIEALTAEKEKYRIDQEGKPITLSSIAGAVAQNNAKLNGEILMLTAQGNALINNIALAETQIKQAVEAKYGTIEESLRIAKEQRDALRPALTEQEKIRADVLDAADEAKKQAIAEAKNNDVQIKQIMLNAIDKGVTNQKVLSQIANAKTLQEALGIYAQNAPAQSDASAIKKEWLDYLSTSGIATTGKTDAQLQTEAKAKKLLGFNDYMTMDANRKRAINTTNIIQPVEYENAQKKLEGSKDAGGFVNTDVYKSERNAAKDKTTFDKNFSYMLNPNDRAAAAFISNSKPDNITPEQQSMVNDAKALIDQSKQRFLDWSTLRTSIIEQEKKSSGFDLSPWL